jgi:tRNA threonylcarbamoyladenosine biosynthesis protein TsaB
MLVMGLDTALAFCSVAILRDGRVLADLSEPLEKGHAERLAPMAAEALAIAGVRAGALNRVGVVVGPGGFAGVRVGLAFARGLALGTKLGAIGVTSLEALAAPLEGSARAAVVDARRGEVYAALYDAELKVRVPPFAAPPDDALKKLREAAPSETLRIAGATALLGSLPEGVVATPGERIDAKIVARLAARASEPKAPPAPLYIRPPDVKPPAPSRFAALLRTEESQ